MASKAQIDRLAQRIEALAPPVRYEGKVIQIIVPVGETEEAALERHYVAHPEDRRRHQSKRPDGLPHIFFIKIVSPSRADATALTAGAR